MRLKYFAIILLALVGIFAIQQLAFGQDTADPPAEPVGQLVMRDADGNTTGVTQVVSSAQYQAMIQRQAEMNATLETMSEQLAELTGKVDYLVTEHAVGEFENENPVEVYINTATLAELQTIPGIGAVKAGSIVADRGTPGIQGYRPFESWADMANRVSGIGPATVADMQAAGVQLDPPVDETP